MNSPREAEVPSNLDREHGDDYSRLSYLAFVFLTFNSILAVYGSINDPWMVAVVVASYVDLMSLLCFLRVSERSPEHSPRRRWLKVVAWTLAATLTLMFSYKVAPIMPPVVKVIVGAMASTTSVRARMTDNSNSEATHGSQGGPEVPPSPDRECKDEYFWLPYLGFAFLTCSCNSILAAYRFINDPWMVAFVVGSYVDLMSLFYFLRVSERTPEHSPRRRWLEGVVWGFASIITLMFGYKAAPVMPLVLKTIAWAMASTTSVWERETETETEREERETEERERERENSLP